MLDISIVKHSNVQNTDNVYNGGVMCVLVHLIIDIWPRNNVLYTYQRQSECWWLLLLSVFLSSVCFDHGRLTVDQFVSILFV
jgi:hypothetical protein